MRTEILSENHMQQFPEHPSEDDLERFILHRINDEEELDGMETHILACHSCVTRLEELEIQIAATKMALADLHQQTVAANFASETAGRNKKSLWSFSWLNGKYLSLAGAVAAIAMIVTVIPHGSKIVEKDMSAFRGAEINTIPAGQPVLVHLNAKDLPENAVSIEVVSTEGDEIWNGAAKVDHQMVDAKLPPIDTRGNYLFRIYAAGNKDAHGELLREFSFDVK